MTETSQHDPADETRLVTAAVLDDMGKARPPRRHRRLPARRREDHASRPCRNAN